ncbi:hypothetical protein [Streptomyces sp. NPDC090057]|uniref:hypothetical protein n=1 Tax=Streptomyces sp. NPDC090057 TaxID=3365935 RepID=UPI0037F7C752
MSIASLSPKRLVARCATLEYSVVTWKSAPSPLGCSTQLQNKGDEEHEAGKGVVADRPVRHHGGAPDDHLISILVVVGAITSALVLIDSGVGVTVTIG